MDKPLIINEWQKGIGESVHVGFGEMKNIDIYFRPGVAVATLETGAVGTSPTDLVKWIVRDDTNDQYFFLGDTGILYKYTGVGGVATVAGYSTTNASGNGLAIWKDYLIVARDALLDVYGPLSSSPSWTLGWQTLSANDKWHPILVGQDDKVYIGDGHVIDTIEELTNFAPGTAASYDWTPSALDIPEHYRIKCLSELGNNLMIGTIVSDSTDVSAAITSRTADIFPWDKSSPSFDTPIRLNDFGVHQMQVIDNLLYVTAGNWGHIYITNGSSTKLLRQLPQDITTLSQNQFLVFYPGACMSQQGKYYFGVSKGGGGNVAQPVGMWSLSPSGQLVFEQSVSTGTTTTTNAYRIGALHPRGERNFWMSWRDNASYGLDSTSSNGYTNYKSYIISPMYTVGSVFNKRTFTQIEFSLDRPLTSGQGIRLSYRTNLTDSFTTIGTYDYATYSGIQSFSSTTGITGVETIQIKIELTEASATRFGLREIRLI